MSLLFDYDVCVIGSGAGGAPIAFRLASAGKSVVVLEKGPWYREADFKKDEIDECRRHKFFPKPWEEPQSIDRKTDSGEFVPRSSYELGYNFWNGNMVGGATNIMSGFFHRLKPCDFRLLSEFGPIDGANIVDWPISYSELEPYYELVEREVGISGRVVPHPNLEPRSTPDFPYPSTFEHPLAKWFDQGAAKIGAHSLPLARAILPHAVGSRNACSYSGYCGNYGCSTGAKGSARAALLDRAVKTGLCEIRPNSSVFRLVSDAKGKVIEAHYHSNPGEVHKVSARIFVVACQPIETTRLLLLSTGPAHPNGLANRTGLVGKNLISSSGGGTEAAFPYSNYSADKVAELKNPLPFINRAFQDWYTFKDPHTGRKLKGGTMDFIFIHPNPIGLGRYFAFNSATKMVWGDEFKLALRKYISEARHVTSEIFADFLPIDSCFVGLDSNLKDKYGVPVARVRMDYHPHQRKVSEFLTERAADIYRAVGATDIEFFPSAKGSPNLLAGTCRFGQNADTSVLDPDCRAHDVENLYVTDGSFMPTGGSVPYTWTVYANSFRVADRILNTPNIKNANI